MKGVLKRVVKFVATAVVAGVLVAQPAVAAPNTSKAGGDFGAVLQKIIRALEEIRIIYPPG